MLTAENQNMSAKEQGTGPFRQTMPGRINKPEVIIAGVFANKLLSVVDRRFAVQVVGDEFIDWDSVDFANVRLVVIFGYGHKIAERHLNKANFINLHGSLLPLGRGPHPHIWDWINGEPHGVTIQKMTAEIDNGPVIVQRKVELEPWESSINSTMYALADALTELFRKNWNDLAERSFALKSIDPRAGSSHQLNDTQQIRDLLTVVRMHQSRFFLEEVKARMAALPSRQLKLRGSRGSRL
jgi:methionyl-tRNA formyltransferase